MSANDALKTAGFGGALSNFRICEIQFQADLPMQQDVVSVFIYFQRSDRTSEVRI